MPPPKSPPPLIFINTDNNVPHDRIYQGIKAGGGKAEELMQKTIIRIIEKAAGFTTNRFDDAKGYTIRFAVSAVEVGNHGVKCTLSGSIEFFPPLATAKRGKGTEMLSTSMTGHASADGTSERSIMDCVEAITEDLTNKSLPIMKTNFPNHYSSSN